MQTTWQRNFKAWQEFATKIRQRAEIADRMRADRAWALAASVGIPRCGCSLHNAAIDDEMRGWCAGNPRRLKVAKRANYIMADSRISRLADSIVSRAYSRMVHD